MKLKFYSSSFFWWIFLAVLAIVFVFIFIKEKNTREFNPQTKNFEINNVQYVKIAGKTLKVDLALTSESQERGLSGRKDLKEDEGMLFVFDQAGKYPFWMKDMNFPLDMVWISDDLHVVYIKKNALPLSYPEIFTPDKDAKYVLEIISSFSEKNNLKVGDKVKFLSS